MRLYLLSYADKELTNSLVLASDWLNNIRVWLVQQNEIHRKSHKMISKIPLILQILDDDIPKVSSRPKTMCDVLLVDSVVKISLPNK